jgi:hypothetical protein
LLGRLSCSPPDPRQVHAAPGVEPDALTLQQQALGEVRSRLATQAQRATSVEDPVPGNRGARGERVEGVTHLARSAGQSRELGHLAIRGDTPAGDAADNRIDTGVGGHGRE